MSRRPIAYWSREVAERVAVGGEALLDLRARIGEECERHRLGQTAAVGAQKLVDLSALVSDVLVGGVDGVDNQDDVDGVLAAADGAGRT